MSHRGTLASLVLAVAAVAAAPTVGKASQATAGGPHAAVETGSISLRNGVELASGGIMSDDSDVQVDFDTGQSTTRATGRPAVSAGVIVTTVRNLTAAEITSLRAAADDLDQAEISRDACPNPPNPRYPDMPPMPKAPIADSIRWLYVIRAGGRFGGVIRTEYCQTPKTEQLLRLLHR